MLKAIIFDLDGIIVDSEPLHFEAHKKSLEDFGIDLSLEDYLAYGVAKGSGHLYEKMSEKYGIKIDTQKVFARKKQYFKEIFESKAAPRPGIIDLIKRLSKKYDLAIASSGAGEIVNFILEKFGIKNYFKAVVAGEDAGRVKPFPDIYNKTIQLLGVTKEECVAIEDSETGLAAAKNAGLKCFVVPCDFTKSQDFSRAELVLDSMGKIAEHLA